MVGDAKEPPTARVVELFVPAKPQDMGHGLGMRSALTLIREEK